MILTRHPTFHGLASNAVTNDSAQTPPSAVARKCSIPRSGLRPGSGPQPILPPAVSRDVRTQFGRHCQQLDELLGGLESTSDQLALLDFMAVHQAAQAAFLRLARSGG